jgi:hypothetical protein
VSYNNFVVRGQKVSRLILNGAAAYFDGAAGAAGAGAAGVAGV